MGDEGGVLWDGCLSRAVGDRGWTSGCAVAGLPGRIWCQSLFSTSTPGESRDQHNFLDPGPAFNYKTKTKTLQLQAFERKGDIM